MAGQNLESVDELRQAVGHPMVLTGSAFALGVVVGLFLKGAAKRIQDRAHAGEWHREYERTMTYVGNLPDSLERREPAPYPGQPRFGGTGALGVPPATVGTAPSGDGMAHARDKE